jgi:uncharacterized membrane protein
MGRATPNGKPADEQPSQSEPCRENSDDPPVRTKAMRAYPYILFNLVLSMLAAIQAPIILMSQNRQAERDRLNAEHDHEVSLKAELEIMLLHNKVDLLRENQWGELLVIQKEQLKLLGNLIEKKTGAE